MKYNSREIDIRYGIKTKKEKLEKIEDRLHKELHLIRKAIRRAKE